MKIIDTPWNVTSKLACLKSSGVKTIIRYYNFSNSRSLPEKCLQLDEAQHICAQGMSIVVVFQQRQNKAEDFSREKGLSSGRRAYSYARDSIGQPENSAIYFGVDFDADDSEFVSNILPFFQGVKEAFEFESNGIVWVLTVPALFVRS